MALLYRENKFNRETLARVTEIVDAAEARKMPYFFSKKCPEAEKQEYARKHALPEIRWTEDGREYSAEYVVECRYGDLYAYGVYKRDGKITTLLPIKNSMKRMEAILS